MTDNSQNPRRGPRHQYLIGIFMCLTVAVLTLFQLPLIVTLSNNLFIDIDSDRERDLLSHAESSHSSSNSNQLTNDRLDGIHISATDKPLNMHNKNTNGNNNDNIQQSQPRTAKQDNDISKPTPNDNDTKHQQQQQQQQQQKEQKQKRMNILVFYADDWRYDSLGSLNKIVKTPYLDLLAKQGMLFSHNAVTTSICWISRACLATGQHYARHKTKDLPDPVPFHQYWNDTLFGQLRNNGYFTGAVGKWQPGQIQEFMFNHSNIYSGFHFEGDKHITDMNERDALHFLQHKRKGIEETPFALFVNFFAPHHHDGNPKQYLPQKKTESLYQNITIPFAPTATEEAWKKMPYFFDDNNEGRIRWRDRFDEPLKAQTMIKNYFRLISGVDQACGSILYEIEKQDLLENTLIIFTTDNGYFHAEHGLADKFYAHQESIRVPLIIKDPRMNKDLIGKTNDAMTLSIDLAPTILEAAGIPVPDRMQGDDMSKLYRGDTISAESAKEQWRNEFYYEYPGIISNPSTMRVQALVRKDYKYMNWIDYKYEELFHLPSDPYEENNLLREEQEIYFLILNYLRDEFKRVQAEAQ